LSHLRTRGNLVDGQVGWEQAGWEQVGGWSLSVEVVAEAVNLDTDVVLDLVASQELELEWEDL
jgi:hypothetical protein